VVIGGSHGSIQALREILSRLILSAFQPNAG
jgi:hypothetical protein